MSVTAVKHTHTHQAQIQDFVKRGPASEAELCQCRKAESCKWSKPLVAGVQGQLKALKAFGFLMLKYAFLPHSRDSFSLICDS